MKTRAKKAKVRATRKTKMRRPRRGTVPEAMALRLAFGKRIRELRESQGLSQDQLGFEAGLDRVAINRIENGKFEPGIVALFMLAKALGLSVAELMDFKPEMG